LGFQTILTRPDGGYHKGRDKPVCVTVVEFRPIQDGGKVCGKLQSRRNEIWALHS